MIVRSGLNQRNTNTNKKNEDIYRMRAADEIIYHNDVNLLAYIVGEMLDIVRMLEDNEDKIKLVMALYDFEAAHRTRTNDLLKLQRGVDKARLKYNKVLAERNEYHKRWKEAQGRLDEYMAREL